MTYLSFFEKFKILFNSLANYKIIILFALLILGFTILYFIKKISSRFYARSVILSLIMLLLTSIIVNERSLIEIFDGFATLFFKNLYFPSVYVYLGMHVILLIVTVITTLSKNIKKEYKVINVTTLILSNLLFILILNIVATNRIDVFAIDSLYTNTELVVVLEISMGLFLVWLSIIMIVYTTSNITARLKERKDIVETIITTNVPEIDIFKGKGESTADTYKTVSTVTTSFNNYDDVELPKLKQPETIPIFNYFNLPSNNRVYGNDSNLEVFSADNYNMKLKKV